MILRMTQLISWTVVLTPSWKRSGASLQVAGIQMINYPPHSFPSTKIICGTKRWKKQPKNLEKQHHQPQHNRRQTGHQMYNAAFNFPINAQKCWHSNACDISLQGVQRGIKLCSPGRRTNANSGRISLNYQWMINGCSSTITGEHGEKNIFIGANCLTELNEQR